MKTCSLETPNKNIFLKQATHIFKEKTEGPEEIYVDSLVGTGTVLWLLIGVFRKAAWFLMRKMALNKKWLLI